MISKLAKKYLANFTYFYTHLRYRIFVVLALSISVGILDDFGLAMFIPLLEFVESDGEAVNSKSMGNLAFLVDGINSMGLTLSLTIVLLVMLSFFYLRV